MKLVFFHFSSILLIKNIKLLILVSQVKFISLWKPFVPSIVVDTAGCFDRFDLSDDSPTIGTTLFFFLMDPQSFLLKFMEVLEFTLPLTDNQKLFSLFLHFKWIFLVLLEIHILVLSETKGWEHSWIASCSHALWIPHPGNYNWLRWEPTRLSSSESISSWLIISTTVS